MTAICCSSPRVECRDHRLGVPAARLRVATDRDEDGIRSAVVGQLLDDGGPASSRRGVAGRSLGRNPVASKLPPPHRLIGGGSKRNQFGQCQTRRTVQELAYCPIVHQHNLGLSATGAGGNPIRHRKPINAWGNRTKQCRPRSCSIDVRQQAESKTRTPLPPREVDAGIPCRDRLGCRYLRSRWRQ